MVHATILVMLKPGISDEAKKIARIPGVSAAYPVFGHYDYVVFVDAPGLEGIGQVADNIEKLGFVRYVETLVER